MMLCMCKQVDINININIYKQTNKQTSTYVSTDLAHLRQAFTELEMVGSRVGASSADWSVLGVGVVVVVFFCMVWCGGYCKKRGKRK